jgi:hypothetical protein
LHYTCDILTPAGKYPISALPVHSEQLGDTTLHPQQLAFRFEEQKRIVERFDTAQVSQKERKESAIKNFGITERPNLVGSDASEHVSGPAHLEARVRSRTQVCYYLLAKEILGDESARSIASLFWGPGANIDEILCNPPQMDGVRSRSFSSQFPLFVGYFSNICLVNCLKR